MRLYFKTDEMGLTIKRVNSPWAYIREGLLSEGCLHLRFGGLIFGGAYYWNFTVLYIKRDVIEPHEVCT